MPHNRKKQNGLFFKSIEHETLFVVVLCVLSLGVLAISVLDSSAPTQPLAISTAQAANAITAAPLTAGGFYNYTGPGNLSIRTAAITIKANSLALIWVAQANGTDGSPVLTSSGRTWVQIGTSSPGLRRLSLYRSMEPVDTFGPITINAPRTWLTWSAVEYANVDTSGLYGSGAIAQSAVANFATAGVALTTLGNVSLAEQSFPGSATAGGFMAGSRPFFAGNGYTLTGNLSCVSNLCMQPEFRNDFASVVNMTWPSAAHWIATAAELKPVDSTLCGNGFVDGYEECDDGNTVSCDSCSVSCQAEVFQTGYQDLDIDSYGNVLVSQNSYCLLAGYVSNNADCDDSLSTGPMANPGLSENILAANCNDSIDNDCDGAVDLADSGCTATSVQYVIGNLTLSCNSVCAGAGKACNLNMTNAQANTLPSCSRAGQDAKRYSDNVCGDLHDGCTTARTIAGERSCACQ